MAATENRPLFIRLTLPEGLEEALEGLAREVLRTQPENIYEFAANHFDQILKKRTSVKDKAEKESENGEKVDGVDEDDGTEIENIEERTATPEDTQVRSRPASSKPRKSIDIQMPSNQETEEVDIDLTDPDVEAAAWKCIDIHFLPCGTPVYLKNLPDKLAAFNGRSGLINGKRKEGFLYAVKLHGFFGMDNDVEEFFIDVPPTHVEIQVGMNDMLCFNHSFEQQMMDHGMMPPGQPTKMPKPRKFTAGQYDY